MASETEWPPGPWHIEDHGEDEDILIGVGGPDEWLGEIICKISPDWIDESTKARTWAKARLIVAAPALAAACRMALLHLSLPYTEDEPIERQGVLSDLRAALALAEKGGE